MAGRIALDLKQFKHVKSDKNSTTLRHKDGHELTVAHNKMPAEFKEQLKALSEASNQKMAGGGEAKPQYTKDARPILRRYPEGGEVSAEGSSKSPMPSQNTEPPPRPAPIKKNQVDLVGGWSGAIQNAKNEIGSLFSSKAEGGRIPSDIDMYNEGGQMPQLPRNTPTMADGGNVAEKKDKPIPRAMPGVTGTGPGMMQMAKGGEVDTPAEIDRDREEPGYTNYADGGAIDDRTFAWDHGLPCLNPNCKSNGKPHPNCRCYLPRAKGGAVVHYCRTGYPHDESCPYHKGTSEQGKDVRHANRSEDVAEKEMHQNFAKDEAKGRAEFERQIKPKVKGLASGGNVYAAGGFPEPIEDDPGAEPIDDTDSDAVKQLQEQARKSEDPKEIKQLEQEINSAEEMQKPAAEPTPAPAQAPEPVQEPQPFPSSYGAATEPYQKQSTEMPDQTLFEKHGPFNAAANEDELKKFKQELLNPTVTPKTYHDIMFKDKGALGKIMSVIGVIAGGMGSGLTHQPNAALQVMDNIIKNDMEAQQKSKDNTRNLWNLNYQHALHQAQANGLDANAENTREMAKQAATARTRSQKNAYAYITALEYAKNLPEPARSRYLEAISLTERAANADASNRFQQMDANARVMFGPNYDGQFGSKTSTTNAPAMQNQLPVKQNQPEEVKYHDEHLAPGSAQAPLSEPAPTININWDRVKHSAMLGKMNPDLAGSRYINDSDAQSLTDKANLIYSTNVAMKEMEKQYKEMWKHGTGSESLYTTSGGHIFGLKLPDIKNVDPEAKQYWQAASAVEKQISNVIKNGGSEALYNLIENQLPKRNDTPDIYRKKLSAVYNILQQQLPQSILRKYPDFATGLPR